MLDRIAFAVGGRPVQWQRTGHRGGQARVFTPKAMREAAKRIEDAGKSAMGNKPPMTGPVRLTVVAVYAVPKSWPAPLHAAIAAGQTIYKTSVPDLDNIGKLASDALNGVAYHDDSQVAELVERKRYGNPERTDIIVQQLSGADPDAPAILTPADRKRQARAAQPMLDMPRPAKPKRA
jgi:Holliday junction resolvase RusA-like endonuclease